MLTLFSTALESPEEWLTNYIVERVHLLESWYAHGRIKAFTLSSLCESLGKPTRHFPPRTSLRSPRRVDRISRQKAYKVDHVHFVDELASRIKEIGPEKVGKLCG